MTVPERLNALRALMKKHGMKAYIIPSSDYHQSEYVAEHWQERKWISGFTGSAGTVVVTEDEAGLWTDGRYFIQAEKQLQGSGIKLFKMFTPGVPEYFQWIAEKLQKGDTVGYDGRVISGQNAAMFEKFFAPKNIKSLISYDLVGELWDERPSLPDGSIFEHDTKYAGESRTEKIKKVRANMAERNATTYLLTTLDDVAWLFNLRGGDVPNSPVFSAFAIITMDKATLFTDTKKLDDNAVRSLKADGIIIKEYIDIERAAAAISAKEHVLMDPAKTAVSLISLIDKGAELIYERQLVTVMKSVKSPAEIKGMEASILRDSAALVKFLAWLDANKASGKITEISATEKLRGFRSKMDLFMGTSFNTIAAYRDHAAMMHYSSTPETDCVLEEKDLFLVDSGGQYLDGTTDVTRTIAMGALDAEQKRDFTLVLKSHIALASCIFPEGTIGAQLDAIARRPVWDRMFNYGCGTGHGVGFFLNVHEGPQNLSPRDREVTFKPGMNITIEPGIYLEDKYGIRTENMYYVAEAGETESGRFFKFINMTWVPIDIRAIDKELLTKSELKWLNDYHKKTCELIRPFLDEPEIKWLETMTKPL